MHNTLKRAVIATNQKAQYDAKVKNLLGHKIILAHILTRTVDEFKGMNPREVIPYIEGTPYISKVPIEPGMTNHEQQGQQIIGLNTENVEINEGLIRFDIIFYVRLPSEDSKDAGLTQIIINVEAQKDEPTSYEILNRAIFYASRLVSSQKERDFVKSGYDDIKRVYSIWICMNMEQNSMNHIHFVNDAVIGNHEWKGKIDLINIIMIGIAKELPEQDERYELHRLLGALLSQKLTVDEKMSIMETEYDIELEENLRRDVSTMCNLSEGIEEKGIAIGEARAEATMIARMHKNGMQPEQIAAVTEKSIEEVRKIIADCENGYIEKKQDEKDSRKSRIYFTEKGRSICEDGHKKFVMIQEKLQEYFTKEEQEELKRLLNKFCDCLDEQTEILKKERKEKSDA